MQNRSDLQGIPSKGGGLSKVFQVSTQNSTSVPSFSNLDSPSPYVVWKPDTTNGDIFQITTSGLYSITYGLGDLGSTSNFSVIIFKNDRTSGIGTVAGPASNILAADYVKAVQTPTNKSISAPSVWLQANDFIRGVCQTINFNDATFSFFRITRIDD